MLTGRLPYTFLKNIKKLSTKPLTLEPIHPNIVPLISASLSVAAMSHLIKQCSISIHSNPAITNRVSHAHIISQSIQNNRVLDLILYPSHKNEHHYIFKSLLRDSWNYCESPSSHNNSYFYPTLMNLAYCNQMQQRGRDIVNNVKTLIPALLPNTFIECSPFPFKSSLTNSSTHNLTAHQTSLVIFYDLYTNFLESFINEISKSSGPMRETLHAHQKLIEFCIPLESNF